jgi:hypothetical protein
MSRLITRLKRKLGIYSIALPIENTDDFIREIIEDTTIPVFSQYNCIIERVRFNLHNLEKIEQRANYETYLLPDVFSNREILYVSDVSYDEATISGIGYWGGGVPLMSGSFVNQSILANAGSTLSSRMIPKLTFKYEHPRKITLYNVLSSCHLVFEIAFAHDKSLASIPPTAEESFFELACLDVEEALYGMLKHYNELDSPYGKINLRIDDYQSAAQDRKQLLNEWDDKYHLDGNSIFWA